MNYHFIRTSSNQKLGPLPATTTSAESCPPTCSFLKNGCYADAGPIEVAAPPGVSPNALDAILESLKVMNRRQIRIETRLVLLMKDHGLDSSGRPADML